MRIGFLIDRWQPERGGAERALTLFADHLEKQGHQILAFGSQGPTDSFPAPGSFQQIKLFRFTRGAYERALGQAMVEQARKAGCDLTVGVRHLPEVDFYWPHGGAHRETLAAIRHSRNPKLAPLTRPQIRGRHRVFIALEEQLLARGEAKKVVCVSALVAEELTRHYPACGPRLVVVPNGIDRDLFAPSARATHGFELRAQIGLDRATPLLTFPARNPMLKGLPTLLKALGRLDDQAWHLLVAGPKKISLWRRAATAAGIPLERITFCSQLPGLGLAAASDLLVLPTWRDPCPLVILEALSCGTPVVTTRMAGQADFLASSPGGTVLENPGDHVALARAIRDWLLRVAGDGIEREVVRDCTRGMGLAAWLDRLEGELLGI